MTKVEGPMSEDQTAPLMVGGRRIRCVMAGINPRSPIVLNWAHAASKFADVYGLRFGRELPAGWDQISEFASLGHLEGLPTISIVRRHVRPTRLLWRYNAKFDGRTIAAAISDAFPGIDLIHGHWYASSPSLLAASSILGCPYVHSEHSSSLLMEDRPPSFGGESMLRRLRRNATRVIAVGDEVARALQVRGFVAPTVIPNPVDSTRPALSADPRADEPLRLITIGRLIQLKRHELLLEALAILLSRTDREVSLKIVGDGALHESLSRQITELGIDGNVTITGWLSREAVANELASSHIYIHTSRIETFSVSLVEAMLSGLPSVVAASGGVTQLLTKEQGEIVDGSEPSDFAAALSSVIGRLNTFDRNQIHRWALDRYSMDAVAKQLRGVYAKALVA